MKKDLNYYLALPYKTEIVPIPEEEGGGYMARLPQFGSLGIVGDGDTKAEALADLAENQKERFEYYLEEGLEIPEPEEERDNYSGRFVLRVPKYLHKELAQSARKNEVSLNHYVNTLLAMNFQSDRLASTLNGMQEEIRFLNQCIGSLDYHFNQSLPTGGYDTGLFMTEEYLPAA
ncbi:MAG: toxin-antitoxin system HicB family antitoxin [Thermodesulfobacteriota bacterium]